DGPHPHVRRTGCRAHDRGFGNRRVDDARLAELLREAISHLEGAAVGADVFAEDEDALVALHLLPHPLAQGFEKRDFGHYSALNQSRSAAGGSTYTPGSAVSAAGSGSSTHASVAWSISTRTRSSLSLRSASVTKSALRMRLTYRSTGSFSRAQRSS